MKHHRSLLMALGLLASMTVCAQDATFHSFSYRGDDPRFDKAIASAALPEGTVRLKIVGHGQYYDFFYAVGVTPYQTLAVGVDAALLSTHDSGGFIGACIGLYATSNKS